MTITSFNPRSGAVNGVVEETSRSRLSSVVATAAATAPELAVTSPQTRRHWLYALAGALEADIDGIVELAEAETALGTEKLHAETLRTATQLRLYGDTAVEGSFLRATIDRAESGRPQMARTNQPVGPVAVFGASNFPISFSVLGHDTASAIAAGCPVVVKAHPAHPLLGLRIAELAASVLVKAGAPVGTFDMVTGFDIGVDLVKANEVAAVGFTGSQAGGLALWRAANERTRVIPVYAEMGTVNPVVVTPAAAKSRMPEIAAEWVSSFTLGAGQFCTKPGLLFVPEDCDATAEVAARLRACSLEPVMLTNTIAAAVERGIEEYCQDGASLVERVGGRSDGWSAPAAVLEAPIEAIIPGSRLLEECFGPVVVVVQYSGIAEVLQSITHLQGALAASVMAADGHDPDAGELVTALANRVGRVAVGDWPPGVPFTWAQHHGGPWPSTTNSTATSVGPHALERFVRPVAYQSICDEWLPPALQESNPWRLPRRVNGLPEGPDGRD